MKLFLVFAEYDWDHETILGAFSTRERADMVAAKQADDFEAVIVREIDLDVEYDILGVPGRGLTHPVSLT